MAKNNFKIFNENLSELQTMSDSEYSSNSQRENGVGSGVADRRLHNKLFRQATIMNKAIADFIVDENLDANDDNVVVLKQNFAEAIKSVNDKALNKHRNAPILDHPNGCVYEKHLNVEVANKINDALLKSVGGKVTGDTEFTEALRALHFETTEILPAQIRPEINITRRWLEQYFAPTKEDVGVAKALVDALDNKVYKKTDYTRLFSANGYVILPNGFTLQWGKSKTNEIFKFPIAFKHNCLGAHITPLIPSAENVLFKNITVSRITKTECQMPQTGGVIPVSVFAIGH